MDLYQEEMQIRYFIFKFFVFFLFFSRLNADYPCLPHQLYLAPDVYHVHRHREGGSYQSGWVYGGSLGYDYIKENTWYLGVEGFYTVGELSGSSSLGNKLKSRFYDSNVEGRVGYTFQFPCLWEFRVTPYLGGGYAWEKMKLIHPSLLRVQSHIGFGFFSFGFLSQIKINCDWDFGINFKARYMLEGKSRITNNPDCEDVDLLMNNRMHYRIEMPVTYHICLPWEISLMPFYEYRVYGRHPNFPFDFLETRLNNVGAMFKVIYSL